MFSFANPGLNDLALRRIVLQRKYAQPLEEEILCEELPLSFLKVFSWCLSHLYTVAVEVMNNSGGGKTSGKGNACGSLH